jgi:hypothetical protein
VYIHTFISSLNGIFIFKITDDYLHALLLEVFPLGLCSALRGEDGNAAELGALGEDCV